MTWTIPSYVAWQTIAQKAVIVDLKNGRSVGLNETGSLIWQLLPDHSPDQISAALAERFEIDSQSAAIDVEEFIRTLHAQELLTATDR